jgi:hypothetical protein
MSPAPTKTGSSAGSGLGVALDSGVGVGASVAVGATLGRTVGVAVDGTLGRTVGAGAAAVGRQALGLVTSGCPQAAAMSVSASMNRLASSRRVLIGILRIWFLAIDMCSQYSTILPKF